MQNNLDDLLRKYQKEAWIMLNEDHSDPIFEKYISSSLSTYTIGIVSLKGTYYLINQLDAKNTLKLKIDPAHIFIYTTIEELKEGLEKILGELNFPKTLSLSYSTMGDKNTDILSHGRYLWLTKMIEECYHKYHKKVGYDSAEELIYDIASQKSPKEIARLRLLASISSRILENVFEEMTIGMTEIEIVNLVQRVSQNVMKLYIGSHKIVSFDMAWEDCPIVLTGRNLAKGGHSLPSRKKLGRGDTIYFDFGLKVIFEDDMTLYTDIQRMGYALREKESKPPKRVLQVFQTLVEAIECGIEEMRPGIKGYEIDELVRGKILKKGYPDYPHATGHPVGNEVHDIGTIISTKNGKRARMPLIENAVYTLEPRINIANGGSIEEMILVTKYGGEPLCQTQKKLFLVR